MSERIEFTQATYSDQTEIKLGFPNKGMTFRSQTLGK